MAVPRAAVSRIFFHDQASLIILLIPLGVGKMRTTWTRLLPLVGSFMDRLDHHKHKLSKKIVQVAESLFQIPINLYKDTQIRQ